MGKNRERIIDIFQTSWSFKWPLAKSFLIATIIYFAFLPLVSRFHLVSLLISHLSRGGMILTTTLIFLGLFLLWSPARKYWGKYKNSYSLILPPFLLTDYFFAVIFFLAILISLSGQKLPAISSEFVFYFWVQLNSIAIWFLLTYFLPFSKPQEFGFETTNNFPADAPIKYPEQDTLGRNGFVNNLFNEITSLAFNDAFVFGLYGRWGEGKTSVLNLLKRKLKNNERFITVDFQPWRFRTEDIMFNALYSQIEETVGEKYLFPDLFKELRRYKRKLSLGFSNLGVNLGLELGLEKDSVDQMRQNIQQGICRLGEKIVIIIDDIDRLQSKEILLIFQAVRSHMMFENLIFVLSFDDKIVARKLIKHGGHNYLSKIIQMPIQLPPPDPYAGSKALFFSDHGIPRNNLDDLSKIPENSIISVDGYVKEISQKGISITTSADGDENKITVSTDGSINNEQLDFQIGEKVFVQGKFRNRKMEITRYEGKMTKFRLSEIDTLFYELLKQKRITSRDIDAFDKEIVLFFRNYLSKTIKTFRDVKRFVNSLRSSLPPIAGEVDLRDFILLEFLKVFYSDIYDDIFSQWWFYVRERFEGDFLNNPQALSLTTDENKDLQNAIEHIKNLVNLVVENETDRMVCFAILKEIFPPRPRGQSDDEGRRNRRISSQSFIKYFTLKIPETELPDAYVEAEVTKWKADPSPEKIASTLMEVQKGGKLLELIIKLNRDYSSEFSEELSTAIVRAIYQKADKFSRVGTEDLWNSEYDKALGLTFRLINTRVNKSNIQTLVEEVIRNTPDLAFATHAVLFCTQEGGGSLFEIYDSVDLTKLRNIVIQRLEEHFIKGDRNIFYEIYPEKDWVFVLYQWGSNFMTFIGKENIIVNNYILKLLKEDPKMFYKFINIQRRGGFKDDWKINLTDFSKVYDVAKFVNLAKKFLISQELDTEENKIIKMFIDST